MLHVAHLRLAPRRNFLPAAGPSAAVLLATIAALFVLASASDVCAGSYGRAGAASAGRPAASFVPGEAPRVFGSFASGLGRGRFEEARGPALRRAALRDARRLHGFRHGGGRGLFGAPVYLTQDAAGQGDGGIGVSGASRQPPAGPVSFADLPASTGIAPVPPSAPLFMRVSGRSVVADNGERVIWRAGPGVGRGEAGDDLSAAPKIIILRR